MKYWYDSTVPVVLRTDSNTLYRVLGRVITVSVDIDWYITLLYHVSGTVQY